MSRHSWRVLAYHRRVHSVGPCQDAKPYGMYANTRMLIIAISSSLDGEVD